MTSKSRLLTGMCSLRHFVLSFTVAVTLAVPFQAECEWPQTDDTPAMIDPSQPDFLAEVQQQSVESTPPAAPPVEVSAVIEAPVEAPSPAEAPPRIPVETPVPVEPQAEIPVEAPAATETPVPDAAPADGETLQEEIPQAQETPQ